MRNDPDDEDDFLDREPPQWGVLSDQLQGGFNGVTLNMDRGYSSIKLCENLLAFGADVLGTVMGALWHQHTLNQGLLDNDPRE